MALSTEKEVEQLADSMGKAADAIHERILKGIGDDELTRAQAQSLFQDETTLRVKANALYLEALQLIVKDLDLAQAELIKVVNKATTEIKKIEQISNFIDLVADLLVLAAAAYAAKPGPILAAVEEVRNDVKELTS
jgi:hypothetical protein